MRLPAPLVLLLGVLAGCSGEEPFQARFAVRGRWKGERVIDYRIEGGAGALSVDSFRYAIKSALEDWRATGCATFREASVDEEPDLVFAWRRGAHDACAPFGTDASVAHSGPVGPRTFVHFDSGRDWSAEGEHGLSLRQAALHEIGHTLGLDHSPDEQATMYPEPARERSRLGRADLAGIHSLYGGGASAPGDLTIASATGALALTLHEVAPPEVTDWALFDTDGDGDEELLVWRTDDAPLAGGALWEYHFAPGPVLDHTIGPAYGVAAPGLALSFTRTSDGQRLLLLESEEAPRQARRFDAQGLLQNFDGALPDPPASPASDGNPRNGDLDGDGKPETVTRRE